ncbi:MAG: Nramp family divalent metal transporter [Dehalococcoidia bacterium]|nr:Nramp family divalent metal transporter [Dehalococcoidia bacterium]
MSRKRLILILGIVGPGIIVSAADNDAGGIATYSVAGANYGYEMLWIVLFASLFLAIVQEMCARMGVVTGKGLADLIRENFGVRWTSFAMVTLFIANVAVTMAEFAGVAAALEIFGVSRYISVPLAAIALWLLLIRGSYRYVERVFLVLALSLLAYLAAGLLVGPDWSAVAIGTVVPSMRFEPNFLLLAVAVIGTTITPWMQFVLQSSVVDKGLTIRDYKYARLDVYLGAFYTFIVCYFIVITAGATLHPGGVAVQDAQQVALALAPLAGQHAEILFAVGLLGVSFMAGSILPLSTAYAICEAFGLERGVSYSLSEAPAFYSIYTALIALGAGAILIPDLPLVKVMLFSQDVNGILIPVVLIFILLLVNNRRLMGQHANGRWFNVVAWASTGVIIAFTLLLLGTSILGL